jgi:hypothetical protein
MRVCFLLILATTSLLNLKQSAAQEKLKVAPNVPWLGRPAPPTLRKLLPAKAQILKCGVAAFGPQGAMRWVVAWTNRDEESDQDIKIGLFSQDKGGFRKWSERSILTQNIYLPMKLYWLQPLALSGPIIQLGEAPIPKRKLTGETVRVVVFPQSWNGKESRKLFFLAKTGLTFTLTSSHLSTVKVFFA